MADLASLGGTRYRMVLVAMVVGAGLDQEAAMHGPRVVPALSWRRVAKAFFLHQAMPIVEAAAIQERRAPRAREQLLGKKANASPAVVPAFHYPPPAGVQFPGRRERAASGRDNAAAQS